MEHIQKALEGLGLGLGLTFSAAIFAVCKYIGESLTSDAKKRIQNWLDGGDINKDAGRQMVIKIFDKIYGEKLVSLESLLRSVLISFFITCIVIYNILYMTFYFMATGCCGVRGQFSTLFIGNMILDYLALFWIRWGLIHITSPTLAILAGPVFGFITVIAGYTLIDVVRFSIETRSFDPVYFYQGASDWINTLLFS